MILRTGIAAVLLLACVVPSHAEDPVFSGPQVGETLVPFQVIVVGGRKAGTQIDPIDQAAGAPTLLVFVHKLTRPGMALARGLTAYAADQEGVATGIVWLDDDKAAAEAYLNRASKSLNFVAPVGISVDGGEGPGAYGLNRNVELTILVAKENEVTANFALVQPSVTEGPNIAGELAKLIDKPAPSAEQFGKYAYPGGNAMRMQRRPGAREAAAGDDLRTLMRGLISASDDDAFAAAVEKIETWVGDNDDRRQQLRRMAGAALERGIGSDKAQTQFKAWRKSDQDANDEKEKKDD